VPQTSFLNRKIRIIQGKWLGGSSVINGIDWNYINYVLNPKFKNY
jgi:hypothetical protein